MENKQGFDENKVVLSKTSAAMKIEPSICS